MREYINLIVPLILSLLPSVASAQNLPSFDKAKEIDNGRFPNGISYYIVTNGESTGFADFALIWKGLEDRAPARSVLSSLPHFKVPSYQYLAKLGVGYQKWGMARSVPGATVVSFRNVPLHDQAAVDSTLLMIFDLAASYDHEQAVVVSGDVKTAAIKEKMRVMSLGVNPRTPAPVRDDYVWVPSAERKVAFGENSYPTASTITVEYTAPRTPQDKMGTLLPLVSSMYANEFADIVTRRLEAEFGKRGIPIAGVSVKYFDSTFSDSDEKMRLRLMTSKDCLKDAARTLSSVLSALDSLGVTPSEYQDAKDRLVSRSLLLSGNERMTNREYVDKCIASYLYGSGLAPSSAIYEFFAGRRLTGEREVGLFDNYISALLDRKANLSLTFTTPKGTAPDEGLEAAFDRGWEEFEAVRPDLVEHNAYGDTLSLALPVRRVKLSKTEPEPVSGGEIWTFSNGIRVVYKKTAVKGRFDYTLLLKGGYSYVKGLEDGESAFVGDVLGMYGAAGMDAKAFREMLDANGLTMGSKVSLSDLRISGSSPSNRIELLLKSLLSLANARGAADEIPAYYRSGEALRLERLRLTQQGVNELMDSLLCPESFYTDRKCIEKLGADLPARAAAYFDDQFSKVNDGMLVLVGDLDADALKKLLCRYLGDFRTSGRRSVRPKVPGTMRSGWTTYTVDARRSVVGDGQPCISVALSADFPYSIENYVSFKVACAAVEKELVRTLAPMGLSGSVTGEFGLFPEERMVMYVGCRPCEADGLPAGVEPANPYVALNAVRAALTRVCHHPVADSDLKAFKAEIADRMTAESSTQEAITSAVLKRYSEGKDVVTGFKDRLSKVTSASIGEVLRTIDGGSMVEYVIK